jgi:hypothetical protein
MAWQNALSNRLLWVLNPCPNNIERGQQGRTARLSSAHHALASEAALHKYFPTGQALNELLPVGRRLRLWYRGVMPSEYKNQGIDHRDYGLHDRQGPEVPGF